MNNSSSAQPRSNWLVRKFKVLGGILLLLLVAVFLFDAYVLGGWGMDLWRSPWAHSLRGEATLVGTWYGELVSPKGAHRMLYLDLKRSMVNRTKRKSWGEKYSTCNSCPRIEGSALFADDKGQFQSYEVWGSPDNRAGTKFHINGMRINGQELVGLTPEQLTDCVWNGDEMRCQMVFGYFNGMGSVWSSDDPEVMQPITILFKRGTENDFREASRKLLK